jgi:hypothetical protein
VVEAIPGGFADGCSVDTGLEKAGMAAARAPVG